MALSVTIQWHPPINRPSNWISAYDSARLAYEAAGLPFESLPTAKRNAAMDAYIMRRELLPV